MKNRFYSNFLFGMVLFSALTSSLAMGIDSTGETVNQTNENEELMNTVVNQVVKAAHLSGFIINTSAGSMRLKVVETKDKDGNFIASSYIWEKVSDFEGAIDANAADIDSHTLTMSMENALQKLNLVPSNTRSSIVHDIAYGYVKTVKNIFYDILISQYKLKPKKGRNDIYGVLNFPENQSPSSKKIPLESPDQFQKNMISWYESAVRTALLTPYGTGPIRWHKISTSLKQHLLIPEFQIRSKAKSYMKPGASTSVKQSQEKKKEIKKGDVGSKKESSTPSKEIKEQKLTPKNVNDISKTTKIKNLVKDESSPKDIKREKSRRS
ncbi:MAG: hypothetical protein B7Y25_04660 [Alphaproteobacteria bacterium 16-39-46]|nr:MAG: hypothetical protein B7Y25_04660 [Alphaproteobacteria bacterium 16-39-46]OZA42947.1 MAG: hypothetical protein B7X84_04485 [Alphaproteobacteria bacterium 17-39-52]HQS84200.1 hypothetical protein [Alphaproteobacteria bacterium]HQS94048.1 hypothetical protein [Alphaproteobacteria bacterium]